MLENVLNLEKKVRLSTFSSIFFAIEPRQIASLLPLHLFQTSPDDIPNLKL